MCRRGQLKGSEVTLRFSTKHGGRGARGGVTLPGPSVRRKGRYDENEFDLAVAHPGGDAGETC